MEKTEKKVGFSLPVAETRSSHAQSSPVLTVPEEIIECFCSAIRGITEKQKCVGVLVSNDIKHQVWVPRAPLTSARIVSLAELLSLPEPPMIERLKLAVRLASSVLQFHTSGWLQERWDKKDIYLVQRGSSQSCLETPVVLHSFTPELSPPNTPTKPSIFPCNLSLFSLGIVLIELWFWKSVESFQAGEVQADPDTARYMTAFQLITTMNENAGMQYGSSVRRCICGLDHPENRLEDNGFKSEVYLKVLQPLEKHLEFFCDKPLGGVFEKQGGR